jgi:hypothetical protein
MPCYYPLRAIRGARINPDTGKNNIIVIGSVRNTPQEFINEEIEFRLPCGKCHGCRLERSRQWALRCMHEAKCHRKNVFLTLTYNDGNLPESNTLVKKHWQLFVKKLRRHIDRQCPKNISLTEWRKFKKIKYYHAGEYGDEKGRPHYHAIMFNVDFEDKWLFKIRNGEQLYRSATLEKLWPYGYSTIGSVTFESAAYVARYCLKKKHGDQATMKYNVIDYSTGEIIGEKIPEYQTQSNGIGLEWYKKYKSEVYTTDSCMHKGMHLKPPRYYDKKFEVDNPNEFQEIKDKREKEAEKNAHDNTPWRLKDKEMCSLAKIKRLKRRFGDAER